MVSPHKGIVMKCSKILTPYTGHCLDQFNRLLAPKMEVFSRDLNHTFLYMNSVYRKRVVDFKFLEVGVEPVGMSLYDIFDDQSADDIAQSDQQVFQTGKTVVVINIAKGHGQDAVAYHDINIKSPLFDEEGKIIGLVGKSRSFQIEDSRGGVTQLSQRQLQTLAATYNGYYAKQAAAWMDVSTRTVEAFLDQVKNKLHLKNRNHIFQFVVEQELTDILDFYFSDIDKESK